MAPQPTENTSQICTPESQNEENISTHHDALMNKLAKDRSF
jgi:hypothetical protein